MKRKAMAGFTTLFAPPSSTLISPNSFSRDPEVNADNASNFRHNRKESAHLAEYCL